MVSYGIGLCLIVNVCEYGEEKLMIPEELQELLTKTNSAIVAVNRPSGGPQVTPVWYLWDGEAFYFSTTTDRAKFSNIKRDPAISLIVDEGSKYVAVYGQAQIIESDFADIAERLITKYVAPEQQHQWVKITQAPGRIIVKLKPEKVVASKGR